MLAGLQRGQASRVILKILNFIKGNFERFYETRPQRLCLMCGRCCRCATTSTTYPELQKMVEEGDESAKDFLSIFDPYSSPDAAREVDKLIVDNVFEKVETMVEEHPEITFYRCKHIQDNNLCGRYETRPELCGRFPTSPWSIVPPGCGGMRGICFNAENKLNKK